MTSTNQMPSPLAGEVHHEIARARLRDAAHNWVAGHQRPREPLTHRRFVAPPLEEDGGLRDGPVDRGCRWERRVHVTGIHGVQTAAEWGWRCWLD